MELAVIINFYQRRSHRGIELGTFSSQARRRNHSATDPQLMVYFTINYTEITAHFYSKYKKYRNLKICLL